MHGCRGCVGCCTKPQLITAVDQPSNGLKIQGRVVKKTNLSDDIWSNSTYEMDNSGVQSQISVPSTSNSNQNLDHSATSGSTNDDEFVNHGLLQWNQMRKQWVGDRKSRSQTKTREPKISCWNATYDSLLGTNKPFPHPIPLREMVDFLVDIWEQEGLYD